MRSTDFDLWKEVLVFDKRLVMIFTGEVEVDTRSGVTDENHPCNKLKTLVTGYPLK